MVNFSKREKEVMQLIAEGYNNQDIADELCIAYDTVKGCVRKILDKSGLNNRVQIAKYVINNQIKEHDNHNVLIIAPHPDDEVLGCYSFLKNSNVLYVTTYHPLYPDGDNITELHELALKYDINIIRLTEYSNKTNKVSDIDKLIGEIEERINAINPHTVLVTNPSYNQDHRLIYDATLTALRHHDTNHYVSRILLYEQPETWDTLRQPPPFRANYYRTLDIEGKLEALQIYKSQLRGHRSFEYIKAIAKLRGQQANMEYAEAFEVVRWCE